MAYVSLYRKYRSQSFSELLGQDHITTVLRNSVQSGRIAHAYLFCGPRGCGKTSTARLLARALNCMS
ncbi:MAG: AAA family ATPase, partial [Armatimonadetes bacterium]|nr:AAA family ATPase [Armatimonadota bacterium]